MITLPKLVGQDELRDKIVKVLKRSQASRLLGLYSEESLIFMYGPTGGSTLIPKLTGATPYRIAPPPGQNTTMVHAWVQILIPPITYC